MTDERRARILEVAEALEAQGQVASNNAVYAYVMGHRGHVVEVLKARRAQQAAQTGGVVVVEDEDEDEDATTSAAATLAEDLRQLESSYEAWHLALERLWEIEQDGPLSEAQYGRRSWLEYQMVQNLRTKERLEGELAVAQVTEAVLAAQQHHDAAIPQSQALVDQTLRHVALLAADLATLAAAFAAQVDPFFPFRDARGMQAFDVPDGATEVLRLLSVFFPSDPRAAVLVQLLLGHPPTEGQRQDAVASCPRLKPFPVTLIRQYLQHHTEGLTHDSHS